MGGEVVVGLEALCAPPLLPWQGGDQLVQWPGVAVEAHGAGGEGGEVEEGGGKGGFLLLLHVPG